MTHLLITRDLFVGQIWWKTYYTFEIKLISARIKECFLFSLISAYIWLVLIRTNLSCDLSGFLTLLIQDGGYLVRKIFFTRVWICFICFCKSNRLIIIIFTSQNAIRKNLMPITPNFLILFKKQDKQDGERGCLSPRMESF